MKNDKAKSKIKVGTIVCTVCTIVIAVIAAIILIKVVVARVKNRPVSFFGTSFSVVQTNSMEPDIKVGDLILFHSVDVEDLNVGDDIVFIADESFDKAIQGHTIVHRIISITDAGIQTKGIHNPDEDRGFRVEENILGKCTSNSATWGSIFSFLSKYGVIVILFVVALPFIIVQIIKIIKYSKERREEVKNKQLADGSSDDIVNNDMHDTPNDENEKGA